MSETPNNTTPEPEDGKVDQPTEGPTALDRWNAWEVEKAKRYEELWGSVAWDD